MYKQHELESDKTMLQSCLNDIEAKISIYSSIDMIRVCELSVTKRELELLYLDLLNDTNEIYLQSIRSKKACAA